MLRIIRRLFLLLFFPCLLFACTHSPTGKEQNQKTGDFATSTNTEVTAEQQSALDAFNILQVSSSEPGRLYSTFANLKQPCYPPDTSVIITQSELLSAMRQFGKDYYTYPKAEELNKLISTAVLAQEEYTVLHCTDGSATINYEDGLPRIGTWVMPGVLGRRDVVLVW